MHRLILAGAAALAIIPALASAALPESGAAAKGAAFIRTTQEADGGFGGFGDGQTFDAVYAIRAAGIDPTTVTKGGKSPADFLRAKAAAQAKPANAAKAALAARALGIDPRNAGADLIAAIEKGYDPATGRYAEDDFSQAIAVIGLACTGNATPNRAILALRSAQLADGGWGFKGSSDPDTAAIAAQALLAAGIPASDAAVAKAVAYFKKTQGTDGGWGFDPSESNASSTAFVVQALIAAGENPEAATYRKGASTPVSFLLSQQTGDGSFKGFDPAFATNQVVPALAGRTFCDAPRTALAAGSAAPTSTAAPTPQPTAPRPPNTGSGVSSGGRWGWQAAVALLFATASIGGIALRRRAR